MKDLIIEKLFFNNAHMGCLNSLKNSSCQSYLYPKYNKHSLINLEQTCMSILKALKFLKALCLMNRNILFVATGEVSSDVVLSYCSENNIPFVSSRWLGGTLTNFLTIQKNLKKFSKLIYLKNRGFLENIDGREKIYLKKKINKLNRKFGGLLNLKKLPSAVIVADCKIDYNAILEAHKLNIPVIGIADSDANIELVTVPILVNVKSRKTIVFLLTLILNLVLKNILK